MSWVVCPYSDHDYDTVVALHDAVYPTYRAQPAEWHAAAQFDELRAQPHRCIAVTPLCASRRRTAVLGGV